MIAEKIAEQLRPRRILFSVAPSGFPDGDKTAIYPTGDKAVVRKRRRSWRNGDSAF